MDNKGIIVNKYGAVDAGVIASLEGRVDQLQKIIEKMAGIEDHSQELNRIGALNYHTIVNCKLPEDIQKMKVLTKCDDYEYQTTPETRKLVKKVRKLAKDE